LWVERVAALIVVTACLAGLVGGYLAARAVERASGRGDQRITAVTSSRARLDPDDQTQVANWVAEATWTDNAGGAHQGQVSVRGEVPVGTKVPARLATDGVVRSRPDPAIDVACQVAGAWLGIAVLLLAFCLICREALGRLAERMRRESWRVAWDRWNPAVPNREEH
jgi:hypothetical protein